MCVCVCLCVCACVCVAVGIFPHWISLLFLTDKIHIYCRGLAIASTDVMWYVSTEVILMGLLWILFCVYSKCLVGTFIGVTNNNSSLIPLRHIIPTSYSSQTHYPYLLSTSLSLTPLYMGQTQQYQFDSFPFDLIGDQTHDLNDSMRTNNQLHNHSGLQWLYVDGMGRR